MDGFMDGWVVVGEWNHACTDPRWLANARQLQHHRVLCFWRCHPSRVLRVLCRRSQHAGDCGKWGTGGLRFPFVYCTKGLPRVCRHPFCLAAATTVVHEVLRGE